MKKTLGSWAIFIVLFGGLVFLISNIMNGDTNSIKTTKSIDDSTEIKKYNAISFEGYLSKENSKYILMGWELKGKENELEKAVDHLVQVEGIGENFVLKVDKITITDEKQVSEEVLSLEGKLVMNENKYMLNDYILKGNTDLSVLLNKSVYLTVRKTTIENEVEVVDIDETFVIEGTLKYKAGKAPDIHYTIDNYDIHHNKELKEYEDEKVKLLVYAKSHNTFIDENHLTLVKLIE